MPHWAATWTASVQGPYPAGNPSAQPDQRFAFPSAETGARDQTFRLMIKPSFWGPVARLRFSNDLGSRPVTFDGVFAALRRSGSVIVPGTSRAATFGGETSVTIQPDSARWTDPVALPFADPARLGQMLAVSFHIAGESGPMTWHAKALTTSYVTPPGAGSKGAADGVLEFPYTTASWFFLNALEMDVEGFLRDPGPVLELLQARAEIVTSDVSELAEEAVKYKNALASKEGENVRILVSDCGPGLEPEDLERIFKPFYRPEASRNRESGGAGLGLAIVKSCVESCQGTVRCRNRLPQGLEVEIILKRSGTGRVLSA